MSNRKYLNYNDRFYKSRAWKATRLEVLRRDNYLCRICLRRGVVTPANTVHHIKPIRVDDSIENKLNTNNLITVCAACHNKLHREKPMTRGRKLTKLKAEQRGDIFVFHANPEH